MPSRRLRLPALAGGLAALLLTGCAADAQGRLPECVVLPAARIVPEEGALFGVNLDWGSESLVEYATALGRRPAVAVTFADVPLTEADEADVLGAADQVRLNGGSLLLTLEPTEGLAAVTPAVAEEVADLAAAINARGVPVVVRFAHEMNGSWYAWGQRPAEYVETFRRVAAAVREGAPGSAMMWAPNNADGYPFIGGIASAVAGTSEFSLLDSDGDGALTAADDPYAAYYPGDDVVDWVGMSLYHWGLEYPWGENELPAEDEFAAQLTGGSAAPGTAQPAPDFYRIYGEERGKPVAVPETAALVVPRGDAEGELAIKQAWWRQVFSDETATRFPELRMINWFEWDKFEPEVQDDVDWTVLAEAESRRAFRTDLSSWLEFADRGAGCVPAADAGTLPTTPPAG